MRDTEVLRKKAETLRALHRPGHPLVLANVWDCASARIVEASGAPAIATTSAGIAFAHGYADGQRIPRGRMLEAVSRIAEAVRVPVTADMEAGYAPSPDAMSGLVDALLDAGAVGLNLEDHAGRREDPLVDRSAQVAKLRAVRAAADRAGVPVVVNARTDAFLRGVGTPAEMLAETFERGAAYRDAGADCIFVPAVSDPTMVSEIVRRLGCPVNVLAAAGSPPIGELARLGVARVSLGSGPARAALSGLKRLVEELAANGTYSPLEGILPHASVNELLDPSGRR